MGELGGEAAGDRDRRSASGSRPPTPRSRTRCSATGSTSTTRTRTRSPHLDRDRCPAALAAGGGATASAGASSWRRSSPATRSSAGSAWRRPARSTRADSIRRRSAASSARRRPRRAARRPRRRRRPRARSGSPARSPAGSSPTSPTGRRRSRCTPPGRRTAALLAARLAAHGAAGPPAVFEGRFGLYHAFLGAERARSTSPRSSPISARAGRRRGSPTSRIPPATTSTARSAPTAAPRSAQFEPGRDRRDRRHGSPRRRRARARAGRGRSRLRGASTRRSSASSTRPRRCSSTAGSACSYSDEAIADPRVLALAAPGALRDERLRDRTPPRSPAACASDEDGTTLEAELRTSSAAPRTRCRPTTSREVP